MQSLIGVSNALISSKKIKQIMAVVFSALEKTRLRNHYLIQRDLTVVFVSPEKMKSLNSRFRKKNRVTDVLSFGAGPQDTGSLGELVLCPLEIKKRGQAHGLTYEEELSYNIIHGILHLLGYDHEVSKSEEKIMFKIQDRIFDQYFRI